MNKEKVYESELWHFENHNEITSQFNEDETKNENGLLFLCLNERENETSILIYPHTSTFLGLI